MLKTWYTGNTSSLPSDYGLLPKPYYWWEAGAMWGGLVNYAHYSGDISYDETIAQAIISQASNTTDFMMIDTQAFNLGNDDILFWTLTALNAAEYNFHVPAGQPDDIYFRLSKNVFNLMVSRWNTTTCTGGLKWQWIPANTGFYYKSTITNTAFFQIAARLGRMTGNQTYIDWANKAYNWMEGIGLIDPKYLVYDGAGDAETANCSGIDHHQWSYNIASTLAGSAYMWNATGIDIWKKRTLGYLKTIKVDFVQPFPNATNIMYERECEASICNTDQISFKAYLAQCLGKAAVVVPEIASDVRAILNSSAQAAAKTCTGGATGRLCGIKWFVGGWDGSEGVGQQMTAFQTISSLLIWAVSGPTKRADSNSSIPATSSTTSIPSISISSAPSQSSETGSQRVNSGQVGFLAHEGESIKDCVCVRAR